jgi:hypothetical protein
MELELRGPQSSCANLTFYDKGTDDQRGKGLTQSHTEEAERWREQKSLQPALGLDRQSGSSASHGVFPPRVGTPSNLGIWG